MISTDENRVVAAVQEWNQNDTYNLYVSETGGVFYTLALENVVSSMGHEGNVMIDLYEVNIQRHDRPLVHVQSNYTGDKLDVPVCVPEAGLVGNTAAWLHGFSESFCLSAHLYLSLSQ